MNPDNPILIPDWIECFPWPLTSRWWGTVGVSEPPVGRNQPLGQSGFLSGTLKSGLRSLNLVVGLPTTHRSSERFSDDPSVAPSTPLTDSNVTRSTTLRVGNECLEDPFE